MAKKAEMRMVGLFGQRSMELAACRILDAGWRTPLTAIDVWNLSDVERDGLSRLIRGAWVTAIPEAGSSKVIVRCTPQFWERVHSR